MTENDMTPTPLPGQWMQVNDAVPPSAALVTTTPQVITRVRAVEDVPATTGIVLDQKVLIPLILLLGVIAGVILIMILDRYFPPDRTSRRSERYEREPSSYQLPTE
jgi:hypothetical protein